VAVNHSGGGLMEEGTQSGDCTNPPWGGTTRVVSVPKMATQDWDVWRLARVIIEAVQSGCHVLCLSYGGRRSKTRVVLGGIG
jgi:hypothetical protein